MNDKERLSPEHYMKTLGCTYEQALELIKDDKETDKGIVHDWDLTKEQMKEGLKGLKAERKVSREKKTNPEKLKIVSLLAQSLSEEMKNVSVVNPEKSIDFEGEDGVKYTVSLVAHRK